MDAAIGLRRVTDQLPFIVGVTQPFSECHAIEDEYPVLHVADGLLRSNIDLAGFALEIEFGTEPGQSWPRDACQLMDRIGQLGMFGLPMVVVTGQGDSFEGDAMSGSRRRACVIFHFGFASWTITPAFMPYFGPICPSRTKTKKKWLNKPHCRSPWIGLRTVLVFRVEAAEPGLV